MIRYIRNSKFTKVLVIYFAVSIFFNGGVISQIFALTTGPSQPEMQGPSAITFDDLVDPFTGDFRYSIPLFEMGDIPLTLNYNAGITLDQESSWVGLGWSLNPGSITRSVRGLPDDFMEDIVTDKLNIRPNKTVGVSVTGSTEVFGFDFFDYDDAFDDDDDDTESGLSVSLTLNAFYNNYDGFGMSTSLSPSFSCGGVASIGFDLTGGTGNFGDAGLAANLNIGALVNAATKQNVNFPLEVGTSVSSKAGLKSLTLGTGSTTNFVNRFGSKDFFCDQSHTPTIEHNFENYSQTYSGSGGGFPVAGLDINLAVSGYGSTQQLLSSDVTVESKGYGYLYLDQEAEGDILMDFNREKENSIDTKTNNLPLPFMTYDVFSISSPGVNGNFRAYRNDVGYIKERTATVTNASSSAGFEFAGGLIASPGFDITQTDVHSSSNTWRTENEVDDNLKYVFGNQGGSVNEEVFFAMTNEITKGIDQNFLRDNLGGEAPVEFIASSADLVHSLDNTLLAKSGSDYPLESPAARKGRQMRVTNISYLTNDQYVKYRDFYNYKLSEEAKGHHIAEITVTAEDGTRYVYGLPAYNTKQQEVIFNIGKSSEDDESPFISPLKNLVKYSETQNSIANASGQDYLYNETLTPAYAHSFMLTAVLSSNYVDVLGDGPTQDDLGTYIKYTYGQDDDLDGTYEPNISNYKWRTPTVSDDDKMYANYSEGLINNEGDDKANIIFGEKEIWYLNKIETKTYTAIFSLLDRADGLGAESINGGIDETQRLKYLSKIELFSTADLIRDAFTDASIPVEPDELLEPIPLKTIHFEYDYTLCAGIPNKVIDALPGDGKLTLKGIWVTYNESYKAKYNAYSFEYSNNYNYSYEANDRWGYYKPNDAILENKYYPYVTQNDENLNDYASAWCMNAINLPQGGRLEIEYESDNYAYVQDREATMMYKVINAFGSFDASEIDGSGYYTSAAYEDGLSSAGVLPKLYNDDDLNLFLLFELAEPISALDYSQLEADELIKNRCVLGELPNKSDPARIASNLYFRFFLNTDDFDHLSPSDESMDAAEERPEFVSGFATINENLPGGHWAGAIKEGASFTKGFICLNSANAEFKEPTLTSKPVHPISKTGWQFAMLNTRYNVLDEPSIKPDLDFESILSTIGDASFFDGLISLFSGPNDKMQNKQIARSFDPAKSWIRLNTIDGNKFGGGHRVKQITMFDNWDEMTVNESGFSYTKEYFYNLPNSTKSSGVASYEPLIGSDEIPQHIPGRYDHKDAEISYSKYNELPYGESFYPSPVVGYSYVEVKNKSFENVNRTATGKMVYEFFTAKDFPVKTDQTQLLPLIKKPESSGDLFSNTIIDLYTGSQGYAIEVNDMHGKAKKVSVFAEGDADNPITENEYVYLTDSESGTLINTVKVVNEEGEISTTELGVTFDFTVDLRQQTTQTTGETEQLNLEMISIGAITLPMFIDLTLVDYSYSSTKLAVTSKVISKNGILKEIITRKEGSQVVQTNLLYDEKTGVTLLTTAQNEYDDNYYSFSYPAHWMYPGMGLASENDNFVFSTSTDFLDYVDPLTGLVGSEISDILIPGDEIIFKVFLDDATPDESEYDKICWVYQKTTGGTGELYLIDKNGLAPNVDDNVFPYDLIRGEVIRSGHRNMASMPVGSLTSKLSFDSNPAAVSSSLMINEDKEILQANATIYSDRWQNFCISNSNNPYCIEGIGEQSNPYNRGFLGIWKPLTNFTYLTDRTYRYEQDLNPTGFNGKYVNIREDGAFSDFDPYWELTGGLWTSDETNWTWTAKSITNNPYLDEVESINALGIYSSAAYGYNNTKPLIVANNAQYKEIGFENFEDEYYYAALNKECDQQHFNFTSSAGGVSNEYAHSGVFSFLLPYTYSLNYSTILSEHNTPRAANEYGSIFEIDSKDCLPSFSPEADAENTKEYLLTFWVKRDYSGNVPLTYEDFLVEVKLDGIDKLEATFNKSQIIEDWQRFEYVFTIPAHAGEDELVISFTNQDYVELFFDDIRVQPRDAVTKTYVYDYRTQWLMAELDENHFSTYYEYDEDGKLVRVKKETEKGILTLQEGRYYTKKAE